MRRHHLAKAATLALVLTAAAILVPTPAAAHARPPTSTLADGYVPTTFGHEYWTARRPTLRLAPPLNRGAAAAILADRDLERYGRWA